MLRIADTFIVENPRTLDEAFELLSRYGESARIVAGGTDILPNIKHGLHAPEVLVNLKAVEGLDEITITDEFIEIGALVSIQDLADHPEVSAILPALSKAASMVAGPQLRNMGTVGGNVCLDTRCVYINQTHFWREALGFCIKKDGTECHVIATGRKCVAAASNDTAPVLMTLGAELVIERPGGSRTCTLEGFYVNDGKKNNNLEPDEVLTRVRIPRPANNRRMAFEKLRVRGAIDFPMLNMALVFDLDGEEVSNMDLVVSAIAARPRRVKGLPTGPLNEELIERACSSAFRQVRPLTNINGDTVWRRDMVPVLLRRAFAAATA